MTCVLRVGEANNVDEVLTRLDKLEVAGEKSTQAISVCQVVSVVYVAAAAAVLLQTMGSFVGLPVLQPASVCTAVCCEKLSVHGQPIKSRDSSIECSTQILQQTQVVWVVSAGRKALVWLLRCFHALECSG